VKVAVLDTGIDLSHPDLRVYGGYNVFTGGGLRAATDDHGHGTAMAGTIAAQVNNQGLIGMAPGVLLYAVKCLDQNGFGRVSDIVRAIQWVLNTDIQLVLMSLQFRQEYSPLRAAIQRLYEKGKLIVAAAGNRCSSGPPDEGGGDDAEGCDPSLIDGVAYPAAYASWVIPVAATNYYNRVTAYSRSGPAIATSGLSAPGGSQATGIYILSTNLNGGYAYISGTSSAAAHIAGIVALALEVRPQLSLEEAITYLQITARDLGEPPEEQGAGLSNAKDLVEALQE
jgi:subtilisin